MTTTVERRDFRRLAESGEPPGVSKAIGLSVSAARDTVARALVRIGITPNALTLTGTACTAGVGYCLARGAGEQVPYFYNGTGPVGWWPVWAGFWLLLANACDMLDGAVARLGGRGSRFGAILDSSLDRISDMLLFLGAAWYFARTDPANLTLQALAVLTACNAVLISYVKARAENLIPNCGVGYWERGERCAGLLIACACGHVPAFIWQLSILGTLTVYRRVAYARSCLAAQDAGRPLPGTGPDAGWRGRLQLWRHPRGSVPYDIVTGAAIAWIIIGPWLWRATYGFGPGADPLRHWLGN